MGDAIEPLVNLRQRIDGALARHGLACLDLAVKVPPVHGNAPEIVVLCCLADEEPEDDGFDEVLRSAKEAEIAQEAEAAKADLIRRLSQPDEGFL